MGIEILHGSPKSINRELLLYAAERAPSLILDCANVSNPHTFFPEIPLEKFPQIFVIEIELLYKFRDVLLKAREIATELGTNTIVITTSRVLFNYDNAEENARVRNHAWELIKDLSQDFDIKVGV